MAIKITKNGVESIDIQLTNGHLEALNQIISDYSLKGEEEALFFMLGVFAQAKGSVIEVGGMRFTPADNLKKL